MTENVNIQGPKKEQRVGLGGFMDDIVPSNQEENDIGTADRYFRNGEYNKAFDIYHKHASKGDRHSMVRVGHMLGSGLGVERLPLRAFKMISDGADESDAESIFELGRCHFEGIGTEIDRDVGFDQIHRAAKKGLPQAQYYIGMLYYRGDYVKKDYKRAQSYLRDAAAQYDSAAQYSLATLYKPKRLDDQKMYLEALKKAVDMGHPGAMGEYGYLLIKGEIVPEDRDKGYSLLKSAADKDDAESARLLGIYYAKGDFHGNPSAAVKYYRKALKGGKRSVLYDLGKLFSKKPLEDLEMAFRYFKGGYEDGDLRCYKDYGSMLFGGDGCAEDKTAAFKVFLEGAEKGDTECMGWVGYCCYNGYGTCRDGKSALKWFETGASNDDAYCYYRLSMLYKDGIVVPRSKELMLSLLREAFDRGEEHAAYDLGQFYEKDDEMASASESVYWYKRGAELNDPRCMLNLAKNYESGSFIKGSDKKAFELYNKSYETRESSEVAAEIGRCYEEGIGTEIDIDKAIEWYHKAAKRNGFSKWRLYEIYSEMDGFSDRAIFWLRRSASNGLTKAMVQLGMLYEDGDKVPLSKELAIEWYHKATIEGNEFAKARFEALVPEDPEDRHFDNIVDELALRIGEDEFLDGIIDIADLYVEGKLVEQDYKRARAWLEIGNLFDVIDADMHLAELDRLEKGEDSTVKYKQPSLSDFFEETE